MRFLKLVPILAAAFFCGMAPSPRAEVVVFAAASTADAVNDIGEAFARTGKGHMVASYAASSTLARQIESGAPASIFISADQRWMDELDGKKLLVPGSRTDLLGNSLVLVAPRGNAVQLTVSPGMPLAASLGSGRLAVGDPSHVPAGLYAKDALQRLGLWDSVKDRLAPAESVRAALAFVERGEAPLGIVYATDAAASAKVRVVAAFPPDSQDPVVYPCALIAGHDDAEAQAFFSFLLGREAKAIFQRYGFEVK